MKVDLEKVTLGHSPLTDSFFVGVSKKPGEWLHKKDITNELIACAISRWNGYVEIIDEPVTGNRYEISIKQVNTNGKNKSRTANHK